MCVQLRHFWGESEGVSEVLWRAENENNVTNVCLLYVFVLFCCLGILLVCWKKKEKYNKIYFVHIPHSMCEDGEGETF